MDFRTDMSDVVSFAPPIKPAVRAVEAVGPTIVTQNLPRRTMFADKAIQNVGDCICGYPIHFDEAEAVTGAIIKHREGIAVELVLLVSMIDLPETIGMMALPSYPLSLFSLVLAGPTKLMAREDFIDRTRGDAQLRKMGD